MGKTEGAPRPTTLLGWIWDVSKTIGVLVAFLVIVAAVAWWEGAFAIYGIRGPGSSGGNGIANGTACKRDRDCASDFCSRRQNVCESKLRTGDACDLDAECDSDNCELATHRASQKTCR